MLAPTVGLVHGLLEVTSVLTTVVSAGVGSLSAGGFRDWHVRSVFHARRGTKLLDSDRAITANFRNQIASYADLQRHGHVSHWASIVTTHAGDDGGFHFIACCPIGVTYLKGAVVDDVMCTYVQSNIVMGVTPFPPEHNGESTSAYEGFRQPIPSPRGEVAEHVRTEPV